MWLTHRLLNEVLTHHLSNLTQQRVQLSVNYVFTIVKWWVLRETFLKEGDLCLPPGRRLLRGRLVQKERVSLQRRVIMYMLYYLTPHFVLRMLWTILPLGFILLVTVSKLRLSILHLLIYFDLYYTPSLISMVSSFPMHLLWKPCYDFAACYFSMNCVDANPHI